MGALISMRGLIGSWPIQVCRGMRVRWSRVVLMGMRGMKGTSSRMGASISMRGLIGSWPIQVCRGMRVRWSRVVLMGMRGRMGALISVRRLMR